MTGLAEAEAVVTREAVARLEPDSSPVELAVAGWLLLNLAAVLWWMRWRWWV